MKSLKEKLFYIVLQNITASPLMYECMERLLKGDVKADFLQKANLECIGAVAIYTTEMANLTVVVVCS